MARRLVLHTPLDPVALATRLRDTLGGRKAKPKAGVTGQGDETMMMVPIGLWWFGTRYSAADEAAIRQFLADTVQAREI